MASGPPRLHHRLPAHLIPPRCARLRRVLSTDALSPRLLLGHNVSLRSNDVLVDGARKICGASASSPWPRPRLRRAILGYGINTAQDSDHLATPQATSLYAEGDAEAGADPTCLPPCLPRSLPD